MGLYDVPKMDWVASPNYNAGRQGEVVELIVIHTTEGGYAGSVGWLARANGDSSAHYLIREDGKAITQEVRDEDTAWHAGNWPYNLRGIGIEHTWFSNGVTMGSQPQDGLYRTGANLTASKLIKYGLPPDRRHVIGHGQIPSPNDHTDPGPLWNWNKYMAYVTEAYNALKTGGAGSGGSGIGGGGGTVSTDNGTKFFTETNCSMGGGFYTFWKQYGGLRVFGFPITNEFKSKLTGLTTQVTERYVLEYHPEVADITQQVTGLHAGREWVTNHPEAF